MMSQITNHNEELSEIERLLWRTTTRKLWWTAARGEGIIFAWEHNGSAAQLKERIKEIERRIADPKRQDNVMRPGSSVRVYNEGYLEGLKDALSTISTLPGNGRWGHPLQEPLAKAVFREVLRTQGEVDALRFTWECRGDIDSLERRISEVKDTGPDIFAQRLQEMKIETEAVEQARDQEALRNALPPMDSLITYRDAYLEGLRYAIGALTSVGKKLPRGSELIQR